MCLESRGTFWAALVALALIMIGFGPVATAQTMEPNKEGPCAEMELYVAQASPGYPRLPMYVAGFGGYFAKTGLSVKVSVANSGADATAALIGRSADVNAGTFGDVLLARNRGVPIIAFAAAGYQEISSLVIKRSIMKDKNLTAGSSIEDKIKALKGLRVGVTSPGSSTDLLVRAMLAQHGFKANDTQIFSVGASAIAPAFTRGQIDAFALSSPSANAAARIGDGEVFINFTAKEYPGVADTLFMTMNTSERTLKEKKKELTCFRNAVGEALQLMKTDPEKATELAWKEFEGAVDRAAFDATIGDHISAFADDTTITREAAQKRRDFLALALPELKEVDIEKTFSNLQ